MKTILIVGLLFAHTVSNSAQQPQPDAFRIDKSKPYVYLQVLSVGPRKPLAPGEPHTGLTLRLVNNSRVPISIVTFSADREHAKGKYQVMDEVVPNPWIGTGEESGVGATVIPKGQKGLAGIVRWPSETEKEIESAVLEACNAVAKTTAVRPNGYIDQHFLGLKFLTIIRPGGSATFSYPIDHISEAWHLEIPFRLALESDGTYRPPYSHLALYWNDLTPSIRSELQKSSRGESK